MKLLRHGRKGSERPGILDQGGRIRDLGGVVDDFGPASLGDGLLERVRARRGAPSTRTALPSRIA